MLSYTTSNIEIFYKSTFLYKELLTSKELIILIDLSHNFVFIKDGNSNTIETGAALPTSVPTNLVNHKVFPKLLLDPIEQEHTLAERTNEKNCLKKLSIQKICRR